ncbi:PepSY domain-containing protein [Croceicoccus sp. Ery15]|uniref:PepSY domain-containing protein n=1 Tax=Croceicoccus sp. Ery15 TaxID=1703338 RepID=UPI00351D54B9
MRLLSPLRPLSGIALFRHGLAALALCGMVAPVTAVPAMAQAKDGQSEARRELRAGNVLPLRQIERSVVPRMGGARYLGPEFDSAAMIYRLKFMEDGGRVVFVDVDARTGRVVGRSR